LPLAVLALSLVTAPVAEAATDSIRLAPRLDAPGEAYVEFTSEAKQTMTGPDGKPMEVESKSIYGLMTNTAAKGDAIEIHATLDRLSGFLLFRTEPGSEGVKSAYDTDDPESEDASPDHKAAFGAILNLPLAVTLDAQGAALAADGADAIRQRLLSLGEQNFVAKSLADEDFADSQILSTFGETPLVLLPFRDVKVGGTWTKTQRVDYPRVGRGIVSYECTLERIESSPDGDVAVIGFKGTLAKDPDEKPAEGQRLGNIDGTFSGTARFSAAQGRFVEIRREMKAKIEVPPWWNRDPAAPLMNIDAQLQNTITASTTADRAKRKDEISRHVAEIRAKREAEEAAATAGPVDPVTPANEPVAWTQWGGPNRDFCSAATGLANRWPSDGPRRIWERPLGDGFSSILCDGATLFTMYSLRQEEDPFAGDEVVVALDAATGKTLWEHRYPAPWPKDLQMEFGPGPHSTPVLVGDRLFTVGCTAQLLCLDKKTGQVIWSRDLLAEHKAALNGRGYGSSPLAYNGTIVLPVSGEKGSAVIAFNQSDGSLAWKGGDFEPGYASLLAIDALGTKQLLAFTGKTVCGLDPTNGETLWSVDHPTQFGANISTPVWCPRDQHVFVSSAYGMGARGVQLRRDGDRVSAKELWHNKKMRIQHGVAVRVGDWVYGSSGDFGPAFLCCVSAHTGEFGWRQRGISKANVIYADGKLIVLDDEGTLLLVKADPAAYRLLGKAPGICRRTAWTAPTLYGRTLFVRDRATIKALDLAAASEG
jgi:outer membrane protein assembly factor BamB